MDSFDIMNPNMDSMLPPGAIFRKTFDSALMGLESKKNDGGGGGDGPDWDEVADLQHEQAMNSYEYDWDNTQRQYNHMLLQNIAQRHDQAAQHLYQTAQQEQQWMYAVAQQEMEYNAQVAAFNKSEEMFDWQVDMNQISAEMATADQVAQTNERYQDVLFQAEAAGLEREDKVAELGFQAQKADTEFATKTNELILRGSQAFTEHAGQKADLALAAQGVDLDIYSKRTAADRKKQGLTVEHRTKRGLAALESQDTMVKGLQALGQAKARGQAGRSTEKQYQAITAQIGRLQAAKKYERNRSDLAYRLAVNGVDATMAEQEAASTLSHAKIGVKGLVADAGYDISKKQILTAENHLNRMYDIGVDERAYEQVSYDKKFELGERQRAATTLSIEGAHERALDKITHDQYAANVNADFNRMSAPSMGIPIPKPLEIPMATIIDPIVPVKGKEPVWGAGMGPGPSSAG